MTVCGTMFLRCFVPHCAPNARVTWCYTEVQKVHHVYCWYPLALVRLRSEGVPSVQRWRDARGSGRFLSDKYSTTDRIGTETITLIRLCRTLLICAVPTENILFFVTNRFSHEMQVITNYPLTGKLEFPFFFVLFTVSWWLNFERRMFRDYLKEWHQLPYLPHHKKHNL